MTTRELDVAVPAIGHDPKRTIMSTLVVGLIVIVAALIAFGLHSYLAPAPIYR